MHKFLPASLALALATPLGALADNTSDINLLRQEIEAIRAGYEARLQALEQRLKAAEAAAAVPPAPTAAAPTTVAVAAANSFNPSISLILSGLYARTSRDPAAYDHRLSPAAGR